MNNIVLPGKVIVEAGHSTTATGAKAYDGTTEHSHNVEAQSAIVEKANQFISLSGSSMAPVTDYEELFLRSTINLINNTRNALYGISIHFNNNNPNATGVEAFVHPNTTPENRNRATDMCDGLSRIIGIRNRGVKPPAQSALGRLAIIEDTNIPMILLEFCFLNQHDLTLYQRNKREAWRYVKQLLFGKLPDTQGIRQVK